MKPLAKNKKQSQAALFLPRTASLPEINKKNAYLRNNPFAIPLLSFRTIPIKRKPRKAVFPKEVKPLPKKLERRPTWDSNFHVLCSRDNDCYPKSLREFFDTPMKYSASSKRRKKINPFGGCLKTANQIKAEGETSGRLFQEENIDNKFYYIIPYRKKKEKKNKVVPINDYVVSIPFLREHRNISPQIKRREKHWNGRILGKSASNGKYHSCSIVH